MIWRDTELNELNSAVGVLILPVCNGLFALLCVKALELLHNYSLSLVSPPQTQ